MSAKDFFETAKEDLEVSKYLFNGGFYPPAVFYLQQSVEKAVKALGILLKTLDNKRAKKYIGHKSKRMFMEFFKKEIKKLKYICDSLKNEQIVLQLKQELSKIGVISNLVLSALREIMCSYTEKFEKYVEVYEKLECTSEKQLMDCISILEQIDSDLEQMNPTFQNLLEEKPEMQESFLDILSKFISTSLNKASFKETKSTLRKVLEIIFKEISGTLPYLLPSFMTLCYLSCIINEKHATDTRYPSDNDDRIPSSIYDRDHPLIKSYEKLVGILEKRFKELDYLFRK